MTIEQRKLELINWIASVQGEEVIERIEDFRNDQDKKLPNTILELLDESSSAKIEDCIEHTTTRELLGRK